MADCIALQHITPDTSPNTQKHKQYRNQAAEGCRSGRFMTWLWAVQIHCMHKCSLYAVNLYVPRKHKLSCSVLVTGVPKRIGLHVYKGRPESLQHCGAAVSCHKSLDNFIMTMTMTAGNLNRP